MTDAPKPRAEGAGTRKSLPPAMMAALWTVSNGRCYAPGCPAPVVLEVRPGRYQKNSQVAHIYGVKPNAARYRPDLPSSERDSFDNLLLLCLAHHEEVDGRDGVHRYPPDVLREWKTKHEGESGSILSRLRIPDTDGLMRMLIDIAEPPLQRLEAITVQLEETGVATAETVQELKGIIAAMSLPELGIDARTVRRLSYAAEVFGTSNFSKTARQLSHAAEVLPLAAKRMESAVNKSSGLF